MKKVIIILSLTISNLILAQTYTSYFTGSSTDLVTSPSGGVCMMGGASEHNEAMKWFLNRADGGDVLILRASGTDGYNSYMYSGLGVTLNSVETIVCNSTAASSEAYIHDKINKAEAIWFAGGDQWDYISYWRHTAIDSLINKGVMERNLVIGGTSAGMAILGKYYFSAVNGTVTSSAALFNPFNTDVAVDSAAFLKNKYLEGVITDTHYDDPDRKGRHVAFLARILVDFEVEGKGIGCNEYTSVCVDTNGIAKVYGGYPAYDEDAYFIQTNCELYDIAKYPEQCINGLPLTWSVNQQVLKVYKVHGTNSGENTFDLKTWESGNGGEWQTWYVENGVLYQNGNAAEPNCMLNLPDDLLDVGVSISPNPSTGIVKVNSNNGKIQSVIIFDLEGNTVMEKIEVKEKQIQFFIDNLGKGVYLMKIETKSQFFIKKLVKT